MVMLWMGYRALVTATAVPCAALIYAAGVSLYSTMLVSFAALDRDHADVRAALVLGVSGWFGSAAGIGLVMDFDAVPNWAPCAALLGVLLSLVVNRKRMRAWLMLAVGLAAAVAFFGVELHSAAPASAERGRHVYIREGCIHCHSQYLRPGTTDIDRWGSPPSLSDQLAGEPPLFGNRRMGPDLSSAGRRRTRRWHELHLKDPKSTSPGTSMPSYSYLFESGDGEDLLAYLDALRAERGPQPPIPDLSHPITSSQSQKLFGRFCAPCHGPGGRGDGPIAASYAPAPRDLKGDAWIYVGNDEGDLLQQVANLIRYGTPGAGMPGFEYLNDADLAGLAGWVLRYRGMDP